MTPRNDKCICSQRSSFDKCVWYFCGFIYIKVHFKLHNSRSNDMQFAFSNYGSIKNKKVFQRSRIIVHLHIQFSLCFCKPESCALKIVWSPTPHRQHNQCSILLLLPMCRNMLSNLLCWRFERRNLISRPLAICDGALLCLTILQILCNGLYTEDELYTFIYQPFLWKKKEKWEENNIIMMLG